MSELKNIIAMYIVAFGLRLLVIGLSMMDQETYQRVLGLIIEGATEGWKAASHRYREWLKRG